jgi:hypothetical protein
LTIAAKIAAIAAYSIFSPDRSRHWLGLILRQIAAKPVYFTNSPFFFDLPVEFRVVSDKLNKTSGIWGLFTDTGKRSFFTHLNLI